MTLMHRARFRPRRSGTGRPLWTKRLLRRSHPRITVVLMSAEFSDGSVVGTEDLPVYAAKTDGTQHGYGGAAPQPWLQRLLMSTAGYVLSALFIRIISRGRTEPFLRMVSPAPSSFELLLSFVALAVYLSPLIFASVSIWALPKLVGSLRASLAGPTRFVWPKAPNRPSRKRLMQTLWFAIVATLLGLALEPAFAVRICIVLGMAEAVLSVTVLVFEQWRGMQVLVLTNGSRAWPWSFYANRSRGEVLPLEVALELRDTGTVHFAAARFFYGGRYDDSMALMKAQFARVPEAFGALNIACCLTRLRRYDEAVSWLRKADELVPLTRQALRDPDLRGLRRAGLLDEFDAR